MKKFDRMYNLNAIYAEQFYNYLETTFH